MSAPAPAPRRNVRCASFREMFELLPERIQRLAVATFREFVRDPSHPALRLHDLRENRRSSLVRGSVSVSINMQYRAVYFVDGDTNVWYWVGSHAEYDRLTGSG